jgi:hypothetical protein
MRFLKRLRAQKVEEKTVEGVLLEWEEGSPRNIYPVDGRNIEFQAFNVRLLTGDAEDPASFHRENYHYPQGPWSHLGYKGKMDRNVRKRIRITYSESLIKEGACPKIYGRGRQASKLEFLEDKP